MAGEKAVGIGGGEGRGQVAFGVGAEGRVERNGRGRVDEVR